MQKDNSNMQIQSPGTEIGRHLCIEIGLVLSFFLKMAIVGDARMSSGSEFQIVRASSAKLKSKSLVIALLLMPHCVECSSQ